MPTRRGGEPERAARAGGRTAPRTRHRPAARRAARRASRARTCWPIPPAPAAVNVRELRREYERFIRLPRTLVEDVARTTALAQKAWADARAALRLRRASAHGSSASSSLKRARGGVRRVCRRAVRRAARGLRARTPERRGGAGCSRRYAASWCRWPPASMPRRAGRTHRVLRRHFPRDRQRRFGERVAAAVGFDFGRGRMDLGVHPSCTGIGAGDCRIAVRFDERDFAGGLFTILHEVGHGLYELGLDPGALRHTARRDGVGRHGRGTGAILGEPGRARPPVLGSLLSPGARSLSREPRRRSDR